MQWLRLKVYCCARLGLAVLLAALLGFHGEPHPIEQYKVAPLTGKPLVEQATSTSAGTVSSWARFTG